MVKKQKTKLEKNIGSNLFKELEEARASFNITKKNATELEKLKEKEECLNTHMNKMIAILQKKKIKLQLEYDIIILQKQIKSLNKPVSKFNSIIPK